ncbi:MAG: hypothetical protein J5521_02785 [Lachnospiraceae bacterium]|nr:hypothetical protein [Lachnospiraceae bacterium]
MKRKIIIEIETDEVAEAAKFEELMDNLRTSCHEAVTEVVAEDSIESGKYFFSIYDVGKSDVHIESKWEQE